MALMNRNSRLQFYWISKEVFVDGQYLNPRKSQMVRNHSPDGFNYSYAGSGPAQLALALLLEATTQEEAVKWYQEFKEDNIATMEQKDIDTTAEFIYSWLENKRKETNEETES